MSYLLDALRKSEAQRQLGELPTLSTGTPYTAPAPGGSRKWLLSMIVLLAVGLGAFVAWREVLVPWPDEQRIADPGSLSGTNSPATVSGGQDAGDPPPPPLSRESDAERQTRRAEAEPRSSRATERREVRRRLAEPEPPVAETPAPDPGPVEANKEVAAVEQDAVEPDPEPEASEPAEAFTPDRREFVHQWELPASVRNELPVLNVMAHIYSDNPENRFVLMNGQRYVEGDSLGEGVTLAEIRREGAVVDFREYRFLVD